MRSTLHLARVARCCKALLILVGEVRGAVKHSCSCKAFLWVSCEVLQSFLEMQRGGAYSGMAARPSPSYPTNLGVGILADQRT